MTPDASSGPLAAQVAERLRADAPWEVFAERLRRYEVHFNGPVVEVVRGPLLVEGFGIRLFRPHGDQIGTGFRATTDLGDAALARAIASAESIATRSFFPAKSIALPATAGPISSDPPIVDAALWANPMRRVEEYVAALLDPFEGLPNVVPSFGSVRATLAETSIANSAGLRAHYRHTTADLEVAVKAFGGPEGAPPGEYWVNDRVRRLDPAAAGRPVADWARWAQDARRAHPPTTGELPVILPAGVLAGILPTVIGFRCSGQARLRGIAPEPGTSVAAPTVTLWDDATLPWAPNTAPFDDEGTASGRRALIEGGVARSLLYDLLHGSALGSASTGNGLRGRGFTGRDWMRFTGEPTVGPSTLVLSPGAGGTDAELAEAAGEGILVRQLGWASPDPMSGAFGGEIRIGYKIQHGTIGEPIRGGTVGGVAISAPGAPSLLARVAAIGSTSELADDFYGPSMLVRPLSVAGA